MSTIPTPPTFAAGTVLQAAQLDQLSAGVAFMYARPYCDVSESISIGLTAGTAQRMVFDTENEDNDSMHSASSNSSRITANTAGLYTVHPYARVASAAAGPFTLNVRLNAAGSATGGSSVSTTVNDAGDNQIERMFTYRYQNVGDYLEFFVTATSTTSTNPGHQVTGFTALWELV